MTAVGNLFDEELEITTELDAEGWILEDVVEAPDDEKWQARAIYRHEDGTPCKLTRWSKDFFSVHLGEDGDVAEEFGYFLDAERGRLLAMQAYSLGR